MTRFITTLLLSLALAACGGADVDEAILADAGPTPDSGIDQPDANNMCGANTPPEMCNFFTGCGCDVEGGDKCTVINNMRGCGPAGDQASTTACDQDSQCELGTLCATYADARKCMQFCDSAHACGTDSACFVRVTDDTGMQEGRVCGQVCNLLAQNCAGSAQGCYPSPATLPGVMEKGICVDSGVGAQGTTCTTANECAEGLTCIDAGFCATLCDRNDGNPACPDGTTCKPLAGHTTTGVCQP